MFFFAALIYTYLISRPSIIFNHVNYDEFLEHMLNYTRKNIYIRVIIYFRIYKC